jgi:hypothetical protein
MTSRNFEPMNQPPAIPFTEAARRAEERGTSPGEEQQRASAERDLPKLFPAAAESLEAKEAKLEKGRAEVEAAREKHRRVIGEWHGLLEDYERQKARVEKAGKNAQNLRASIAELRLILTAEIGSPFSDRGVEMAFGIAERTAALEIFEAERGTLKAKFAGQIDALRAFGEQHGIPEDAWPAAMTDD